MQDPYTDIFTPWAVQDIVDRFELEGLLQCTNLREIQSDGIHDLAYRSGLPEHLDAFGHLAKWFLVEFLVQQERKIQVEVVRRSGAWRGRVAGLLEALDEQELGETERRITVKKGKRAV